MDEPEALEMGHPSAQAGGSSITWVACRGPVEGATSCQAAE